MKNKKYLLQIIPNGGPAATYDTVAVEHEAIPDNGRTYLKFKDGDGKIVLDVCIGHTHSYVLTYT